MRSNPHAPIRIVVNNWPCGTDGVCDYFDGQATPARQAVRFLVCSGVKIDLFIRDDKRNDQDTVDCVMSVNGANEAVLRVRKIQPTNAICALLCR